MKMTSLLALILGLAALAFAVKYALRSTEAADSAAAASRPKQQLDNVRTRAKELERAQQQQADETAKKAGEEK